jgi:hypothetical protein
MRHSRRRRQKYLIRTAAQDDLTTMADEWKPFDGYPLTVDRAKQLVAGDLGKEYRAILRRCCAPIYLHQRRGNCTQILNSGTITFLQTPKRLLGVTAAHVVLGYQKDRANAASASPVHLQVMHTFLNLEVIGLS